MAAAEAVAPDPPTGTRAASDREIVSARTLGAARAHVFEAFRDPARLAEWWGPAGFENTFHEFQFRPGGAWRFTMRGPDGTTYVLAKEFVDIAAPERIVLRHIDPVHGFTMAMTFADVDGSTQVTWRMVFDSAGEVAIHGSAIAAANEQNFDRLAAHLGC